MQIVAFVTNSAGGDESDSIYNPATLTVTNAPVGLIYSEAFPFVGPVAANYPISSVGWVEAVPSAPNALFQLTANTSEGAVFAYLGAELVIRAGLEWFRGHFAAGLLHQDLDASLGLLQRFWQLRESATPSSNNFMASSSERFASSSLRTIPLPGARATAQIPASSAAQASWRRLGSSGSLTFAVRAKKAARLPRRCCVEFGSHISGTACLRARNVEDALKFLEPPRSIT